jgi:Cofactor assembly of complex C subunit B
MFCSTAIRALAATLMLQCLTWTPLVNAFQPIATRCTGRSNSVRINKEQFVNPQLFMWDSILNHDVSSVAIASLLPSIVVSDITAIAPPETDGISYSKLSYFTILGLYLMSFPGLWSIITRSTTAKIKRKTYVSPGENAIVTSSTDAVVDGSATAGTTDPVAASVPMTAENKPPLSLRRQAGEIMAYMKANNYEVLEANNETITFQGVVQRSLSQAFFLTFCTALGLLSLALVLQIQFQDVTILGIQPNWFYVALLSPYAGIYYWSAGDRIDTCQVKLETNAEETVNEITVQGSEDEIERMWRTLQWQEKGMIKIDGILA